MSDEPRPRALARALELDRAEIAPVYLALLRVAVAVIVLVSPEPDIAKVVAARPLALLHPPDGLGWLGPLIPVTPSTVTIATAILRVSAVLGAIGLFTRGALAVLAVALIYVFGAAQLTGAVIHDMHLVWFVSLLACVRGPTYGSIDGWVRPPSGSPSDAAPALAIARLWLGLVYFFPGAHKLLHGGVGWLRGDILRGQLYFKWFEAGSIPWPRIDRVPGLLGFAATSVAVLELAMPLLLISRRTRTFALFLGVGFHVAAGHFLGVLFPSLIACWVLALPAPFFDRLVRRSPELPGRSRPTLLLVIGVLFTTAIVVRGALGQTQAYPFACYPTFADAAGDEIVDLAVEVLREDGAIEVHRMPPRRRQEEWAFVWRTAGLYERGVIDVERLRSFAQVVAGREVIERSRRTVVVFESYRVDPAAWGQAPQRRMEIVL